MRAELSGEGDPIQLEAMPDLSLEMAGAPVYVKLQEGEFIPQQYLDLGFTHFEVFCIGGQGGRGGDSHSQMTWDTAYSQEPVPEEVWDLVLEQAAIDDYNAQVRLYNDPDSDYNVAPLLNRVYRPNRLTTPDAYIPSADNWFTNPGPSTQSDEYERWREIVIDSVGGMGRPVTKELPVGAPGPTAEYPFEGHTGLPPGPYGTYYWNWNEFAFWEGTYAQFLEFTNPEHTIFVQRFSNYKMRPPTVGTQWFGGVGGGGGLHKVFGQLDELPESVPVVVGDRGADRPVGQTVKNGAFTPTAETFKPALQDPNAVGISANEKRNREINNILRDYRYYYDDPVPPTFANPVAGGDGGASSFGDICRASGGKGGQPAHVWDGSAFIVGGSGGDGGVGDSVVAGGGAAGSTSGAASGTTGTWDGTIGQGGGAGKNTNATLGVAGSTGGRGSYSLVDATVFGERGQPSMAPTYDFNTGLINGVRGGLVAHLGGAGGGVALTPKFRFGSSGGGAASSPDGAVIMRLIKQV